ncbi:MAG TPA: molybdate ABC transporter substrate-binding protein [Burkholderiales bacterium]|nr:molybdate ABC transporter substrate-binding protein [Burkholderiales bacterium]
MKPRLIVALVAAMAFTSAVNAEEAVRLYAAGSLKAVMTDIGAAYTKAHGVAVKGEFGPSGLLRKRLAEGEPADVFASANMAHPQALHKAGKSGPVTMFARNRLCALTSPKVEVTTETLLERMLDPQVKLGMSTPKADPSGDYAMALYDKAEALEPGAAKALSDKALRLTGGPDSPPPPKDRVVYGVLVDEGEADIFLTYCTNALLAQKEVPSLKIVQVPEALAVGADYGLTVASDRAEAHKFADYILSDKGQALLKQHGFAPPAP